METTVQDRPPRYTNTEYQDAHDKMYSRPIIEGIKTVLPPGVIKEDFDKALAELKEALGDDNVFIAEKLREYIDPYEIPEGGHERNVASAAVW
jgi:hypothetical protein